MGNNDTAIWTRPRPLLFGPSKFLHANKNNYKDGIARAKFILVCVFQLYVVPTIHRYRLKLFKCNHRINGTSVLRRQSDEEPSTHFRHREGLSCTGFEKFIGGDMSLFYFEIMLFIWIYDIGNLEPFCVAPSWPCRCTSLMGEIYDGLTFCLIWLNLRCSMTDTFSFGIWIFEITAAHKTKHASVGGFQGVHPAVSR